VHLLEIITLNRYILNLKQIYLLLSCHKRDSFMFVMLHSGVDGMGSLAKRRLISARPILPRYICQKDGRSPSNNACTYFQNSHFQFGLRGIGGLAQ
jgi:hypothetical protein